MHIPEPPSDDEIQARLRRAADLSQSGADESDEAKLQRLEEELSRLEEATSAESVRRRLLPENDPEFAKRLDRLHGRAAEIRQAREAAERQTARIYRAERENAQGLGVGLVIAYSFLGFAMGGAAIGAIVGHFTGAKIALPAGGFIGILAGSALAWVLIRGSNREL